ncbi:MAG: flavin reductase family protein [bacterium]
MTHRTFDAAGIDHLQTYRLLIGSIVPRPIAWVSTISKAGQANLAPFSFFTCVSHAPPMVSISAGERRREQKDTTRNILETQGYVIHTVVDGWEEKMNESSANFPSGESEFEALGLETVPADLVGAPRIAEAPVAMECRFRTMLTNGEEWRTHLLIGEIVRWHVREDLITEDKCIDPARLAPVGRLGGEAYCRTREIFKMKRAYPPPEKVHPNA